MILTATLAGIGKVAAGAWGAFCAYGLFSSYDPIRSKLRNALYESGIYHVHTRPNDMKREIRECEIKYVYKEDYGYEVILHLPVGLPVSKLQEKIEAVEMALDGEILIEPNNRHVRMKIGMSKLHNVMNYSDRLYPKGGGIQIPLFSRFGVQYINFDTEIGSNVLIGGPPGMGKSKLLDLIMTMIILQSEGKAQIVLINNKRVDTGPYRDVQNVTIHADLLAAKTAISMIKGEIENRKSILESAGVVKVSEYSEYIPPIYIVIDEFARFADDQEFQHLVTEIAETGRSFDVHVIVATQRPDAKEVLNPRIKACCSTIIAFRTTTASNSRVIIGTDDAFHLPQIQGRAILQRSENMIIQVPYLSAEQQAVLLAPYKVTPTNSSETKPAQEAQLPVIDLSNRKRRKGKGGLDRFKEDMGEDE
jgi:hypothetical protein